MSAVLLAAHGDDESLFAFYQVLAHRPVVVVVLDCGSERYEETCAAMEVAEVPFVQLHHPEAAPDWPKIKLDLAALTSGHDILIGPAVEAGGHEHHNMLGLHVQVLGFGKKTIRYLTYRRGHGRSRGVEVHATKGERDLKLMALQCYESQWDDPATRPWFPGGEYGTYQEWVA